MFDPVKQKQFDDERYERLREIVSEYLDDAGGTTAKLIQDLQRASLENSQYFVGRVDEYTQLQDFFS